MRFLPSLVEPAPARRRARADRFARPTHRRARLEPLEDRRLLSLAGAMEQAVLYSYGPSAPQADAAEAGEPVLELDPNFGVDPLTPPDLLESSAAQTIETGWLMESVRVGVWTPQMIVDLPGWLHGQQWPEWMGRFWMESMRVEELVHMPLRSDPRGGYRTILQIDGGFFGVTAEEVLADLEGLDFVDFARLDRDCVVQYTPRLQELIDATTTTGSQERVVAFGETTLKPVDMRVTFWTEERIADLEGFVAAQAWPEALGPVYPDRVEQLVSIPIHSEARGGYFTIVRMGIFGDVSALEYIGSVEHARLEADCVVQYTPRLQELIDATTTTGSQERVVAFGETTLKPVDMRVTFWTEERIADLEGFVTAQAWPEALGPVYPDRVEQLVSIPIHSEARGGYFTIVRMGIFGDVSALEYIGSVEHARLEADSIVHFDQRVQQLIDATTTTGCQERAYAYLAESAPLIEIDGFRQDARFEAVDGSGYAVAVLDTGIDRDHPFFGDDQNQDGIADRIVYQWDYVNDDADASDDNGHGTHVTSIAASEDAVYRGVAPGANIVSLKVLDQDGSGLFAHVEQALGWVVQYANTYNIASVNMSLGDVGNYDAPQMLYGLDDEIADLAAMGVMVVCASGNTFHHWQHQDEQGVAYPAADPNALSVGAVYDANLGRRPPIGTYGDGSYADSTDADRITPFSQRHETLTTVMAPGDLITAAWLDGGTATIQGTSMAAPHVAGMAVLAQQLAIQELGQPLTQDQFANLLQQTGTTINDGDDEDDNVTHTGLDFPRADMFALAEAILGLHWRITADDDPGGSAADDGNPDHFGVFHAAVDDTIRVSINHGPLFYKRVSDVVRITFEGSTDQDTFQVFSLDGFTGNVVVNGTGAGDIVHMKDSEGDDVLTTHPTVATFLMQDAYRITANDVEFVYAYSENGGQDVAYLYDSIGNDTFDARPTYAALSGAGFSNRVEEFAQVKAKATAGGYDVAHLYGKPGQFDDLKAEPDLEQAYIKTYLGENVEYVHTAQQFNEVYGYGNPGDGDQARLYGQSGQLDVLQAGPSLATFCGTEVHDFDKTFAYGSRADGDRAYLADSSGNDEFVARPDYCRVTFGGDPGHFSRAAGFALVTATAAAGGYDVAHLHGTAGQFDDLKAEPDLEQAFIRAYLGENVEYVHTARQFDQVYGYGNPGDGDQARLYGQSGQLDVLQAGPSLATFSGTEVHDFDKTFAYGSRADGDRAYLADSSGNDEFVARPDYCRVTFGGDPGHFSRAAGFALVTATAAAGGYDVARLYAKAGQFDDLKAEPDLEQAYIKTYLGENVEYTHTALQFDQVYGYGNPGDGDQARLYGKTGSPGAFDAWPEEAAFEGPGFSNRMYQFDKVFAYSAVGNGDLARLYGSLGDDTFVGRPQDSYFTGAYGDGFYHRLLRFDTVKAYSGGDGADSATLYDSPGDDTFHGYADRGVLEGVDYLIEAWDFSAGSAIADPAHEDEDTAILDPGTVWQALGAWEIEL